MKKLFLIVALSTIHSTVLFSQDVYSTSKAKVSFSSKTPIEDIDGTTNSAATVLNVKTKQVVFKIQNTSFQFKEKLMQEHFNENYIESEKFPVSNFNGKIIGDEDYTKKGDYDIVINGILDMHGKKKEYKVPGKLVNDGNNIKLIIDFKVRLVDHNIEVPSIVFTKIAEVLNVKVIADYKPYTKV